ncbi:MAG: transposase family protein, partial [Vicinamibacterales bacterium]
LGSPHFDRAVGDELETGVMERAARPEVAANGRTGSLGAKADASRERTIVALLSERSLSAAAKRAGVGERTIRRWLTEDAEFKADLVQARRAIFEAGVERAQALTGLAVETLCDLLGEKKCPAVRLGASRLLLEFSANRNDAATIMAKLEELERLQREAAKP